jgi:hypothetical protein
LRYVLIGGGLSGVVLVTWLLAGRHLVTLLDRMTLLVVERPPVERLVSDGNALELAGKHVDLMSPAFDGLAVITLRPDGRAFLESAGKQFPLGLGRPVSAVGGAPQFEFTKDPGDDVQFAVEQSRLAWPTPFEMNFMTGYAPSRKRNRYLRLRWTKRSGARLHMLWKTGQSYYARDGWLPAATDSVIDGLVRVDIKEANAP